ncbi:hypothetical protein MTO96_006579 [Rhipicephalus appendiculatus]
MQPPKRTSGCQADGADVGAAAGQLLEARSERPALGLVVLASVCQTDGSIRVSLSSTFLSLITAPGTSPPNGSAPFSPSCRPCEDMKSPFCIARSASRLRRLTALNEIAPKCGRVAPLFQMILKDHLGRLSSVCGDSHRE